MSRQEYESPPMNDRELLDLYLDDALAGEELAGVERRLAAEAALAGLLARMRAEREMRSAVYAGYAPAAAEARERAEAVLAATQAPVGRIGKWVRRFAAVAAAVAIAAGAFVAGRTTAPPAPAAENAPVAAAGGGEKPLAERPYTVVYWNSLGEPQVRQFANAPDVDAFVTDLESRTGGGVVASVSQEDGDVLSQQGSF
jgi:anti-sigma factor RsiW